LLAVTLLLAAAADARTKASRASDFLTEHLVLRGVIAFSPNALVRALVRINDDSQEALANVLFRYSCRPGIDFFVVYNEERDTLPRTPIPGTVSSW
jgi:hypothetical protein